MSSAESESSSEKPLLSDFRELANKRRYITVETHAGPVRLQSMTAAELCRVHALPADQQYYASIACCVVNEQGLTTHAFDAEDWAYMKDMDAQVFDALTDAINRFCINTTPFEQLVKN